MDLQPAKTLCLDLMEAHGLLDQGWRFTWTSSRQIFGKAASRRGRPGIIGLSKPLVLLNPEVEVRDTILHEIAHGLAGVTNGHNETWKRIARMVGARPKACYGSEVTRPTKRYKLVCLHCGMVLQERYKGYPAGKLAGMYHQRCGQGSIGRLRLVRISPILVDEDVTT